MSASEQPATMRGPWVRTPRLMLLLLLLVSATLTGTVLCRHEDAEEPEDPAGDSGDNEMTDELQAAPSTSSAPDTSTTSTAVDNHTEDFHGSGFRRSIVGSPEIPDTTDETPLHFHTTIVAERDEGLDLIIILIPAALVVVIIGMIVCGIFISRRWNNKTKNKELGNEDPYLDGSCTEKVPMPMFEDDVPSVLEVEMDELDQWIKKDGENVGDSQQS